MIDITDEIRSVVKEENITEGSVIVYVPHTTAGVSTGHHREARKADTERSIVPSFRGEQRRAHQGKPAWLFGHHPYQEKRPRPWHLAAHLLL